LECGLRSWLFPKGGSSFDQREKKQLVALLAIINGSIKNYYSIFNFQYSIAMQFHRV